MHSQAQPDDLWIRLVAEPKLICSQIGTMEGSITFLRGVVTRVSPEVAEWAMGMNASRQATVFELVEGGEVTDA